MVVRFRRGHATNSGRSAHRFGSTTRAEALGRSLPPVVTPPPTTRLPATWTRRSRDSKSPGDSAMPSSHTHHAGHGLRAVLRRPEVQEPPGAYEPRDLIHRGRRSATLPASTSPHRCRTAAIDRSPLRRSPTGFGYASAAPMRFKLPHPLVLLLGGVVVAVVLTWILPAGNYQRRTDPETGRRWSCPEPTPVGLVGIFVAG